MVEEGFGRVNKARIFSVCIACYLPCVFYRASQFHLVMEATRLMAYGAMIPFIILVECRYALTTSLVHALPISSMIYYNIFTI